VRASITATTFTWTRFPGPPLSESAMSGQTQYEGRCYGLEFSPDGEFLYAT
jgi:hypothetical protein